jgi:hypothetical protein
MPLLSRSQTSIQWKCYIEWCHIWHRSDWQISRMTCFGVSERLLYSYDYDSKCSLVKDTHTSPALALPMFHVWLDLYDYGSPYILVPVSCSSGALKPVCICIQTVVLWPRLGSLVFLESTCLASILCFTQGFPLESSYIKSLSANRSLPSGYPSAYQAA